MNPIMLTTWLATLWISTIISGTGLHIFPVIQTDYLELADQLSAYVVKLLDKVRGHDELEILINKTGRDSDQETYERLARFKLALQYNEKKVKSSIVNQKLKTNVFC